MLAGTSDRHARARGDYATAFAAEVGDTDNGDLGCNCILNDVCGALEGKRTGSITGPATFGEIARVLLNEAMVRLDVAEAAGDATRVA